MKKFLFVFAAVLVLSVGAALVAPSFIDWTRYRDSIAAEIERAAGRKVVIAGTVEASLLPTPRLLLNDARFGNLPGAAEPEMARLRSLEARVALLPLLSGQVVVESFVLREPVVTLEVLADGRRNWVFDAGSNAHPDAWDDQPFVAPESVQLQNAAIVNGTVIYRNARSGAEERFENVNARVVADSLAGPLRAAGETRVGGKPVRFTLAAGRFDFRSAQATPLKATLDLVGPNANVLRAGFAFDGTAQFAPTLKLAGKAKLGGADLAAALSSFGPTGEMPGLLTQPFSFEGNLTAGSEKADIAGLVAQLGDVRSQGNAAVTFVGPRDGKPQFDLALTFGYIDLDAWLDMPARASEGKTSDSFDLPDGFRLSLEASVEAVNFRKGLFRQIKTSAELDEGAITLRQFNMQAPGGTDASASGKITADADAPARFEGRVELASDDFRNLLGWTGLDAKTLPAGRLNKLTATGRVALGVETLEISDLDARFDSTKIAGSIVAALRARPALGANLTIDQINLDAYMPEGTDALFPLPPEFASAFDANLLLRAGQFTWRQVPLRDLNFDGTLDNGNLALRKIAAGIGTGTGEGSFSVSGDVKSLGAKPVVALDITAEARDPGGLYRLSGIAAPLALPGAVKIATRIESDAKGYRLPKIEAALAGTTIAGAATIATDGPRPKISGKLAVGELDTANLLGVNARAGAPWSEAPIALYLLAANDAELDLAVKTLTHKTWKIDGATARVMVNEGALAVESLSGKLLGGDLTLNARLTGGENGAAVEGSFGLAGATAAQGLFASKTLDVAGGKLDLTMEFASRGAHEAALMAAMSGKGQYAVHGASLRGVDLAAAGKRAPTALSAADVQTALRAALAGNGKLQSLDGSFTVENGTAVSDDLTIVMEGAKGEGELRANLLEWTIDGGIEFKFEGDATAPPAQLRVNGPLTAASKSFESAALQAYALERAGRLEAERRAAAEKAAAEKAAADRAAQQRQLQQQQQQQQAPRPVQQAPAQQAPAAPRPQAAPPAAAAPSPNGDSFINDVLQGLPAR